MFFMDFFNRRWAAEQLAITIVSGLPRSGTSMMMQMLVAGGLKPLTDQRREPDENNKNGYFEHEAVKRLVNGDASCLAKSEGKVVKIVSPLLQYLPSGRRYKVIFMQRDLAEILDSQQQMLARLAASPQQQAESYQLDVQYEQHLSGIEQWLAQQPNIEVLYLDHGDVIEAPACVAKQLQQFLGVKLNRRGMVTVVDRDLYRSRI